MADRVNSVRAKVQNFEDEEHYFGKDFYPRCLYLGEDGDPERVEDGYLKSALLVKVMSQRSTPNTPNYSFIPILDIQDYIYLAIICFRGSGRPFGAREIKAQGGQGLTPSSCSCCHIIGHEPTSNSKVNCIRRCPGESGCMDFCRWFNF